MASTHIDTSFLSAGRWSLQGWLWRLATSTARGARCSCRSGQTSWRWQVDHRVWWRQTELARANSESSKPHWRWVVAVRSLIYPARAACCFPFPLPLPLQIGNVVAEMARASAATVVAVQSQHVASKGGIDDSMCNYVHYYPTMRGASGKALFGGVAATDIDDAGKVCVCVIH